MDQLSDFLDPVLLREINDDELYTNGQLGRHIQLHEEEFPELDNITLVIAGITENRGNGNFQSTTKAANTIRKQLYKLHYWHTEVAIADIGNIKCGVSLQDSYAAIRSVVSTLTANGKTVLLIGGSHDNTLAQYAAYKEREMQVHVSCIDAFVDLSQENPVRSKNFLMDMLTGEPNFIAHYNHLAFQSYFVHPNMLETLDKLRFDFYRAGHVSASLEEMEPVLRNTDMLSFDISAIKYSDAPANKECPNGLTGVEACTLTKFAGMSNNLSSIGFYGYDPEADQDDLTAKQISQMVWYFIDGLYKKLQESDVKDRDNFNEYHTLFGEVDTLFLQSKRTQRWWMQMPDESFIPCSPADYALASRNEIPERWLRVQERN